MGRVDGNGEDDGGTTDASSVVGTTAVDEDERESTDDEAFSPTTRVEYVSGSPENPSTRENASDAGDANETDEADDAGGLLARRSGWLAVGGGMVVLTSATMVAGFLALRDTGTSVLFTVLVVGGGVGVTGAIIAHAMGALD